MSYLFALQVITIVVFVMLLIFFIIRRNLQKYIIPLFVITISFFTSYDLLFNRVIWDSPIGYIINGPTLFFITALLKLLILSFIVSTCYYLFRHRDIGLLGSKVLGVELKQDFINSEIKNFEKVENQFRIINRLNEKVLEYLSRPFESEIFESPNQPDTIRQAVKDLLVTVYWDIQNVHIYVIPLTDARINTLDESLAAILRYQITLNANTDFITIVHDKISLAVFNGTDDISSAIIIDSRHSEHEPLLAEIYAAGTLFISIVDRIELTYSELKNEMNYSIKNKEAPIIPYPHGLKGFISYSHEDEKMFTELRKFLQPLVRKGVIEVWFDRKISSGEEWEERINENIDKSDLILLLISADFLASKYCYDIEMDRAFSLHRSKKSRIIPIILRPADWEDTPLGDLQALPKDAKPVSTWPNRDEAYVNIVEGLKVVINEIGSKSRG
jgi:hypothetical protein